MIALGYFTEDETSYLIRQSCSLIFVGSNRRDYLFDRIMIDHESGVRDMLQSMTKDQGVRSVGYLGGFMKMPGCGSAEKRMRFL